MYSLAVDEDLAVFYRGFLVRILGLVFHKHIMKPEEQGVYIVCWRSVSELGCENIQNLATSPTLFTVCVVGIVIWRHSSQPIMEEVWPWPRVADRCG